MKTIALTTDHLNLLATGETVEIDGIKIALQKEETVATGKEIREFYTEGWDGDYYYESGDALIQIEDENGEWIAKDHQLYDLNDLGTLGWQGQGHPEDRGKKSFLTFKEAFLAWKREAIGQQKYVITINGTEYLRQSPQSYYDIVGTWGNAPANVTVTYAFASDPTEGSLCSGQSVEIKDGTIFNVVMT